MVNRTFDFKLHMNGLIRAPALVANAAFVHSVWATLCIANVIPKRLASIGGTPIGKGMPKKLISTGGILIAKVPPGGVTIRILRNGETFRNSTIDATVDRIAVPRSTKYAGYKTQRILI